MSTERRAQIIGVLVEGNSMRATPPPYAGEPVPAHAGMAAGVADHIWTLAEIAGMLD